MNRKMIDELKQQIPLPIIGNVPLTLGNGPGLAALSNPATATVV